MIDSLQVSVGVDDLAMTKYSIESILVSMLPMDFLFVHGTAAGF